MNLFSRLLLLGVLMSASAQASTPSFSLEGRKKLAQVEYGELAPRVRALACTGGRCPPDRLLPVGRGLAWFGYQGLMPIGIVDLGRGAVLRYLDFSHKKAPTGETLALELYGGFARHAGGPIHVLMPTEAPDGGLGQQLVLECNPAGELLRAFPLPGLSSRHLMEFSEDAEGRMWVADEGTQVFSAQGKPLFRVPASGLALRSGLFLSQGEKPRLFDAEGKELGPVTGKALPPSVFWSAAGPRELVTRQYVESESLPLQLHELYVLDPQARTLSLVDYLVFPAPPPPTAQQMESDDARSAPQGFTAFAFDDDGQVLSLEDAGKARFYGQRLLEGPDAWRQKMRSLPDGELSREELDWYRAEYQARLGILEASHPFHAFFARCAWFKEAEHPEALRKTLNKDALWQHLKQLKSR